MASIILDKINYSYSEGTAYQIQALKDINLQIEEGQFIGIYRESGERVPEEKDGESGGQEKIYRVRRMFYRPQG